MAYLINVDWQEFVEKYESHQFEVWVNINKGHALMKSQYAPISWRIFITFIHYLILIDIPVVIVLLFFYKWTIPAIIFVDCCVLAQAMRKISQGAVVRNSLKNPEFYYHAINSGTMGIKSIEVKTEN